MLTVSPNTKLYAGIKYIENALGRSPYTWWLGGSIPDGAPAYATNMPVPDINQVIGGGIFCAGVTNLLLRRAGKRVPTYGNPAWDGGIGAYFGDSRSREGSWGRGYFTGYDEPFNAAKARRIAAETRSGVLIGRYYRDVRDQGHVGVVLPSGYVLQAFPNPYGPDLNWAYTVEESHNGWYYEVMVAPRNWIEYRGDEF